MPFFSGWLGKNLGLRNISLFHVVLIVILLILLFRVLFLQVWAGERYFGIAESNRIKETPLKAPRGIIYDRFRRPLVENVPRFALYVDPRLIQSAGHAEELIAYLRNEFPEHEAGITELAESYPSNREPLRIANDIPYEHALQLQIQSSEFAALQVSFEPSRKYLYADSIGHLIGYVGLISPEEYAASSGYEFNDSIGKSGVELYYESVLRGVNGLIETEVDALGREKEEVSRTAPQRGADLQLTIDMDIQEQLYDRLRTVVDAYDKPGGAAIALDPESGDILGLVSFPSFDPNIFSSHNGSNEYQRLLEDSRNPLFFRPLTGEYPSGSIFKMSVALAALQEGLITDRFSVVSSGGVWLGNRFFRDWRPSGHGVTNIYKAIADSVNTFFYIIGGGDESSPGLGVDMIARYARALGFGDVTGIDLPGEAVGHVPERSDAEDDGGRWYQGDTYNVAIGQGTLLVTPLQVAAYTAYFANGGNLVMPRVSRERGFVQPWLPAIDIDASNVSIIRNALRQTVLSGTAQSMQSVGIPVAGKTGTAQFNNNKQPHSWFTGFAPYAEPEIIVTFLVEEGGDRDLALTAAREFLTWYATSQRLDAET